MTTSKIFNKKIVVSSEESPEHVVFRNNPLVPAPTGTETGRETMFEPFLAFSPVMSSQRLSKGRKSLISAGDIDELTQHLDSLLISSTGDAGGDGDGGETLEETKADEEEEEEKIDLPGPDQVESDQVHLNQKVGLVKVMAYSEKAGGLTAVKRSARFLVPPSDT